MAAVFASDCLPCEYCGELICHQCGKHYAECPCPGPDTETDMTAKTPAQRKSDQRQRDRESGLIEILVKVRVERVDEMRDCERRLQKPKRVKK